MYPDASSPWALPASGCGYHHTGIVARWPGVLRNASGSALRASGVRTHDGGCSHPVSGWVASCILYRGTRYRVPGWVTHGGTGIRVNGWLG